MDLGRFHLPTAVAVVLVILGAIVVVRIAVRLFK